MDTEARSKLQGDLESVLLRRLQEIPRYGVLSRNGDALSRRYVSLMYGSDGSPLAFCTVMPVLTHQAGRPLRIALFGLTAVGGQSNPAEPLFPLFFAPLLWMYVGGGFRRFAVAAATMHPSLIELITRHFSDVYPDYRAQRQAPSTHMAVARHLVESHGADFGYKEDSAFDASGFVLRNTYTGSCAALRRDFHTLRLASDERCNSYCRSTLDYARGDDLLMIGWVDWRAFWRNLPLALRRGRR